MEAEERGLAYACANIARLFTENMNLMEQYQRDQYLPAIKRFCEQYRPVIEAFENHCAAHPTEADAAARACAERFLDGAAEAITERSRRKGRLAARLDMETYRMTVAAFIVPGIGALQFAHGQMLMDAIRTGWNRAYPKYPFMQTDVETLNQGFGLRTFWKAKH